VEIWMRHIRTLITLGIAGLLMTGCASSGGSSGAFTGTPAGSRYLVTESELTKLGDRSAYEALLQLRPSFLRSRDVQTSSNPTPQPIAVFVDGGRTEGVEALKGIRASTVKEMRFYEPAEANAHFGTGHNGGLIAVTLK
jgi:hypothetical protein